jgi:hypothetical protein
VVSQFTIIEAGHNRRPDLTVIWTAFHQFTDPSDPRCVPGLERNPRLAFALCYVAAHYVMDMLNESEAQEIMTYCEEQLAQ